MLFALFGFDLFVEAGSSQIRYKILLIYSFLYVSRFIACIGIDIIWCIHVFYLHCFDCTYLCLTITILVLFICDGIFHLCVYIYIYMCIYIHVHKYMFDCCYVFWIEQSSCNFIDWTFSLYISLDFMYLNCHLIYLTVFLIWVFSYKSYVYINRDTDVFSDLVKSGYEYGTEQKTNSTRNIDRKRGRQESIHPQHRLIATGKQTRVVREGDRGYYW